MVKMCPFTFTSGTVGRVMGKGLPRDCQEEQCAWWTGTECAVLSIAKKTESAKKQHNS